MSRKTKIAASVSMTLLACADLSSVALADPLPGEVLKFQQLPLNNLTIPSTVVPAPVYQGHDEVSTAYQYVNSQGQTAWQGGFMADDFADKLSSPVVHVKWWGSYMNNNYTGPAGVQQFLVAFESDVPAQPGSFSHPGTVLSSQIVNVFPGTGTQPSPGTFTEKLINGNAPEHLYQYNAELNVGQSFPEQKDTTYWLKIVALTADPNLAWGWHDRDYTQQNSLASPAVLPGESIVGQIGPAALPTNVWHFQDDAVRGAVDISPILGTTGLNIIQPVASMGPTNYIDNIDGPSSNISSAGIGNYSKDLAFELYTTPVPEPAALGLFSAGACVLLARRRRR